MMTDSGEKQPLNMMVTLVKEQMPIEIGTTTGEKSQVHQQTVAVRHTVAQRHLVRLKQEMSGASTDSCSQTYRGPEAFSEVEARNVRDYVLSLNGAVKFYQTLHSYSHLVLIPWGYTSDPAPGYDAMYDLAVKGNDALYETHGKFYEVGCIPCVLYTATGTSLDWALG